MKSFAQWLGISTAWVFAQYVNGANRSEPCLLRFEITDAKVDEAAKSATLDVLKERLDPENKNTIKLSSPSDRIICVNILDTNKAADPQYLARVERLCETRGLLEFRILADSQFDDAKTIEQHTKRLRRDGPESKSGDQMAWFEIENPVRFFNLNSQDELKDFSPESLPSIVARRHGQSFFVLALARQESAVSSTVGTKTAWKIVSAEAERDPLGNPCLTIELDKAGCELMRKLTRDNKMRILGILIDGLALSQMKIMDEIGSKSAIYGRFRPDDVRELARILGSRRLPLTLRLIEGAPKR